MIIGYYYVITIVTTSAGIVPNTWSDHLTQKLVWVLVFSVVVIILGVPSWLKWFITQVIPRSFRYQWLSCEYLMASGLITNESTNTNRCLTTIKHKKAQIAHEMLVVYGL